MKEDQTYTFREIAIMLVSTAMMYSGATFVLTFPNPYLGVLAAVLNFFFWTWVTLFFVFLGKSGIGKYYSFKKRLILSLTMPLALVSQRYYDWMHKELKGS